MMMTITISYSYLFLMMWVICLIVYYYHYHYWEIWIIISPQFGQFPTWQSRPSTWAPGWKMFWHSHVQQEFNMPRPFKYHSKQWLKYHNYGVQDHFQRVLGGSRWIWFCPTIGFDRFAHFDIAMCFKWFPCLNPQLFLVDDQKKA